MTIAVICSALLGAMLFLAGYRRSTQFCLGAGR